MKNSEKKFQINIEVNSRKIEELKELMDVAGVNTQREFYDNAITLTKWAMRQKKLGKAIGALTTDDHFTELEMPFLENARNSSLNL